MLAICGFTDCEATFEAVRANHRYCSPKCKYAERDRRPATMKRQRDRKRAAYQGTAGAVPAKLVKTRMLRGWSRERAESEPVVSREKRAPICIISGCDGPHFSNGFCARHRSAWARASGMVEYEPGSDRKRAQRYGVEYEAVNRRRVYERDGWVCGICAEPVDKALAYPDPLSKSLDHVAPVSKGGPHTYDNTQLAHLACNMAKRDRLVARCLAD